MGNDGGTIVKRLHFVRVKNGKENVNAALQSRLQATTCALSHEPLQSPVVGDWLGGLFNKDSVIELLLRRAEGTQDNDDSKFDHIRNLKDVKTLGLTSNPAFDAEQEYDVDSRGPAPFLCPLTDREMDGRSRFVFLRKCGCVMSETGLLNTTKDSIDLSKSEDQDGKSAEAKGTCPVCGVKCLFRLSGKRIAVPGSDVVILNGSTEEVELMRIAMMADRAAEKAKRKEAKLAERDDGSDKHGKRKRDRQGIETAEDGTKKVKNAKIVADEKRLSISV